jgi:hypothetical protein
MEVRVAMGLRDREREHEIAMGVRAEEIHGSRKNRSEFNKGAQQHKKRRCAPQLQSGHRAAHRSVLLVVQWEHVGARES